MGDHPTPAVSSRPLQKGLVRGPTSPTHWVSSESVAERFTEFCQVERRGCSQLESAWVTGRRMKGRKNRLLATVGLGSLE